MHKFGKHKNGYIFPIIYEIRLFDDLNQFHATFRYDNTKRINDIYIYVDKTGIITDISSTAYLHLFELTDEEIQKPKNIDIYVKIIFFLIYLKNNKDSRLEQR